MKNVHPVFQNILRQIDFGNGRQCITKEIVFDNELDKRQYLESEEWLKQFWGYGATILHQTDVKIVYSVSNSAD